MLGGFFPTDWGSVNSDSYLYIECFTDEQSLSEDSSHLGCFVDRRGTYSLLNTEGMSH